jgi:outer membrane protein TolC
LELTRQRLAVDVVASYYNILRQKGLVEVAEGSLERSKELLRASEARLEVGLASKLDVFRAELQISQAEEGVINRQEALELAMDNFKFKLGLDPGEEVALEMVEPEYQPLALDIDELTRTALTKRIEVVEQRARIGDAQRTLSVSRQSLLPQLDLNVRYEQRGLGASFAESFDFQFSDVNVFLSTSYQLDHSAERASYALSQIDIEARRRNLKLVEYNVANEVRAAARNVERVAKSILLQERNIDFAEKQRRLANLRYQRGLASNFDIIDAENNVIQAHSNYVSLLADYFVSLIELKRVTGTLDLQEEFAPGRFLPPARHHP